MNRKTRVRLGAFAGAAALALSIAAAGHAQQAHPVAPPLTDVQRAAVKRLEEVLAVVNTGDKLAARIYFEANSVRTMATPPGMKVYSWEPVILQMILDRYRLSLGLDLVRVTTDPKGEVVGIVRNRTTGDEETLAIRVEPQAPHRIVWFPILPPHVAATMVRPVASVAVTEREQLLEIGSYLKRLADADIFSGAVVIARDGRPVFSEGYGYADRDKKIPNTVDTPFLLASMNKLFTGLAIGQLVEQGKLTYDDPLSKFLSDFPDAESAKKIKIKHLLSHTSGLASPFGTKIAEEVGSDAIDRQITVKAMVDAFERQPLVFEPGTKFAYSNMGFVLLGRIIEIVTGQDYFDYVQKNIFARAGAKSASFPILPKNGVAVVPMAYPYDVWNDFNQGIFHMVMVNQLGKHYRRGSPAGSGIASAVDILKLANAMNAGRIVNPETLRLHSSAKPELGSNTFGYGFRVRAKMANRPLVGHGGNAMGQCTEFGMLKDTPYTLVMLSNSTIHTCVSATERILRVLRPSEAPSARVRR